MTINQKCYFKMVVFARRKDIHIQYIHIVTLVQT